MTPERGEETGGLDDDNRAAGRRRFDPRATRAALGRREDRDCGHAPADGRARSKNLDPQGATVTVSGTGYDAFKGVYVAFCKEPKKNQAPTPCGGGADTTGSTGVVRVGVVQSATVRARTRGSRTGRTVPSPRRCT